MPYTRFETNTHTQITVVALKNAVKRLRIYNIVQNDKISFLHDAASIEIGKIADLYQQIREITTITYFYRHVITV